MERIKRMKRRADELEPEVAKFEMVSVDLSNLDEAIATLKAESDDAHNLFVEAQSWPMRSGQSTRKHSTTVIS